MEDFTIAIYCFIDDYLKIKNRKASSKRKSSDAEIITTALVAARYFGGNYVKARLYLKEVHKFNFPDKSNFSRLLNKLSDTISSIFFGLGQSLKKLNTDSEYLIDSFPVTVCRNIRIPRCKLLNHEAYRGKNTSKREYFYGFKVQIITTKDGIPVEYFLSAGSYADITAFKSMNIDLPPGSKLYGDSGYTDYEFEDSYKELEQIHLLIVRKSNSKRKDHPSLTFLKDYMRKRIEITFSEITNFFPRKIHAVTAQGFILKIVLFIFAFTIDKTL
ncbi:IS982 family transposase [Aureispira anguillae]|uniref:IS982 family transposase n=1 Tax=Aureispira anguillae TaxID=2864201 RepID=A0A915YHX7_9BACT|nr:IS982 family transposase [Aureispira anguillae]BDS13327.1 IS982 family transposase [Aureispira anguillae]